MNNEKFLPIGTVVRLKEAENCLMVTGFCVKKDEEEKIYDYIACMYPQGIISPDLNFLFDHVDIEEILFLGFSNDLEKEYKKALNEVINKEMNNQQSVSEEKKVDNNVINLDIPILAQQPNTTENDSEIETL